MAVSSTPASGEPTLRFLRACRRLPVDQTPVWFMRQAGRYMAEYRKIRERYTLLEICARPEVATEVVLQPIRAFNLDAAILFADILLPLAPMGIDLEFAAGEGPVIHNPVRSAADVDRLRLVEPRETLASVLETVRLTRRELDGKVALIGFAGAPFTLASYLVEGGPSKNYIRTKQLMADEPATWRALMEKLAQIVADYLCAQVEAGAQAVQLFDSWVGALSPQDYSASVLPFVRPIFDAVTATGVPSIHFGTGTSSLLGLMKAAGGDVIGVDWRTPLDWARETLGPDVAIQGNLDPVALFTSRLALEEAVRTVLAQNAGRPGHIFNLGHGILPGTPVEAVGFVVDRVHELTRNGAWGE